MKPTHVTLIFYWLHPTCLSVQEQRRRGSKPSVRDEHAIKTDEPSTPTLDPDPTKTIAATCGIDDDTIEDTNNFDSDQDGGARGKDGARDYANVTVTVNATGPLKYNPILKSKIKFHGRP